MAEKYKQIGNAVPVNLTWAVGRSIIRLLNDIQTAAPEPPEDYSEAVSEIIKKQAQMEQIKGKRTQTSSL